MTITDRQLKGLKPKPPDAPKPYRVFDKSADKGFGAAVSPSGSVSFFVQYTISGKKRFYNLGRYPSVSLAEARERCRGARLLIDKGIDPQNNITLTYGTCSDLFDYYTEKMREEGKSSWAVVKKALDYNCQGIMQMPANMVEAAHIRKILHDILARGTIEKANRVQANRVRSYLMSAFKAGIYHDNDPRTLASNLAFNLSVNPVLAIPKDPDAEESGRRNLSFDEVKTLWFDTKLKEQFRLATKLLLIYGCRPWELLGALKDEFDFDAMIWTIPWDRVKTSKKNKRAHLLPITPMAKDLLDRLFYLSCDSIYLFPSRYDDLKQMSKTSFQHAIDRLDCVSSFVPRDLRRTWKTLVAEISTDIGINLTIMDRIQNHSINTVSEKHYNKYGYMPEKRMALEKWCSYLSKLLSLS